MTYSEYKAYIEDARAAKSAEHFCGEMGYPAECPYSPDGLLKTCEIIFSVAQNDFARLIADYNNDTAFAQAYGIPRRTLQSWKYSERTAPRYIIELLGYALIGDIPTEESED